MGNCFKKSPQPQMATVMPQKKLVKPLQQKGLSLIIKCWKETHNNLFNFNLTDQQLQTQVINIMLKKVRIVKLGTEYQALLPNDPEFEKVMPPVMIDVSQLREKDRFGEKKYTFQVNEFPKISRPFWLVVKSLPNQRYHLKQGDIFKIGKIKIRVKQIIHKNSQTKDMNKEIIEAQYNAYNCEGNECLGIKGDNSDLKCRICMQEGEKGNPLIGLCECKGTARYTHFSCLRQWFTTQLDPIKVNMVTQINWKSLQCQFCKCKLPYSINLDNKTYFLIQFPKIKKPYLVLNPVYKSTNQKSKIYYFISFKKRNRMIIGRKSDADIQLCSDATISRHHSVVEYVEGKGENEEGRFFLQDNGSKFGTVVLLHTRNAFCVEPKMHGVQFQVGGDLVRVNYKTENFFQTISTKEDQIDFNNQELNQHFNEFAEEEQDDNDEIMINRHEQMPSDNDEHPSSMNKQMISSMQDDHEHTSDAILLKGNTGHRFKQ